jgi:hypothetical protein
MSNLIMLPVRWPGLAIAGLALGVGWKLGCYIGDVATGERTVNWQPLVDLVKKAQGPEPLWKRQFSKVSTD